MMFQRLLYVTQNLRVGAFRCPSWHPSFSDTGPVSGHLMVFPRTSVTITHVGGAPIVADPTVVMFYNRNQQYRRGKLSEWGDICEFFSFSPQLIREVAATHDPHVVDRTEDLFVFPYGPADTECYLLQRLVVEHLAGTTQPDALFVEESMLWLLGRVLGTAYRAWSGRSTRERAGSRGVTSELTHAVKALLAHSFRQQLTIDQIAATVYCSPYHLCRSFRQHTGSTIHQYLQQLRLRTSLDYISDSGTSLATLGLELGFASHSHFTQTFHTVFGMTPSELRRSFSARQLGELRKILIV